MLINLLINDVTSISLMETSNNLTFDTSASFPLVDQFNLTASVVHAFESNLFCWRY